MQKQGSKYRSITSMLNKIFEKHFTVFKVFFRYSNKLFKSISSPWIKSIHIHVWTLHGLFLQLFIFSLLFVCFHFNRDVTTAALCLCMFLYVYAPADVLKCWYLYYIFLFYVQFNIYTTSVNMMYLFLTHFAFVVISILLLTYKCWHWHLTYWHWLNF